MPNNMAYQEDQIPRKPSPRAPPPPRSIQPPMPERHKTKQIDPALIKKSLMRTLVALIIIVIFFIIILIASTTLYAFSYNETHYKDVNYHAFGFTVPEVMSQKVPVFVEVEAHEGVEVFLLNDEDYDENLEIGDIRNLSLNEPSGKITRYSFAEELEPGEYKLVTYLRFGSDDDVHITYNITRFVLMPILWLISLIFIILIVLCVVRIFVLRGKKSRL